jgi:hypothetical protein
MIVFSVSLPGSYGDWCYAAIERLAASVLGSLVSIEANTAEELASEVIKTEGQHFYVSARQPNRWLRENLSASNKKFVVAIDDPRHAVNDLITQHNLEPAEATRRVASSCVAISRYVALPGALVITAEHDWLDPVATIGALASHFGLAADPSNIEQIAADLAAVGLRPRIDGEPSWSAHLDEDATAMINGAVGVYRQFLGGGSLDQITWARELFHGEGVPIVPRVIEITGKPRCLIYGPYIALPPGDWTADLILAFSEDAIDTSFKIDVFAGSVLHIESIKPIRPGVHMISFSFLIEEANENLVEIRVYTESGEIFGQIALGHAILTPRQRVSQRLSATLRSGLGLPA